MVYLCTSRGCSDRNEHLEIASHALEINVVCIGIYTHNSPRYDHFVVLTYKVFSFSFILL
jgi:hypothetical protein